MGTNTDETCTESNSKTKKIVNKIDDHTFEAPAGATYEDMLGKPVDLIKTNFNQVMSIYFFKFGIKFPKF